MEMNSQRPAAFDSSETAQSTFAVVIPYFQRERGILLRAVRSALDQADVQVRVVVVDDDSPVPARDELGEVLAAFPQRIEIIRQPNGGPAAARNTGLNHVGDTAEFIALLDSDDTWEPGHLRTAARAFAEGFDFFFCDAVLRDSKRTLFESKGFELAPDPSSPDPSAVQEYRGDFFQLILDRCPVHTSTVVYRRAAYPLRFREDLRTAGEDYSFWLSIAYRDGRVGFSRAPHVKLGTGVSLYAGVEWATNARLRQLYFNQRYVTDLPGTFRLARSHRASRRRLTLDNRRYFVENFSHMLRGADPVDRDVALRYARMDPGVVLEFARYVLSAAASRVVARVRASLGMRGG
jgi:succinoglycan biosynthesis protein ExoW